ncbi:MAG: single-stranded-DNA-specific exonuclease RecJ [Anaerolineales bacterium]|nr:single-stranded-DNA-specific exonuclease RecJ [Anaerolineales bacterium]
MTHIEKRWQIAPRISQQAEESLRKYFPVARQILYNRGLASEEAADDFLDSSFEQDDGSAPTLAGVAEAVDRLATALENHEHIVVYGDYDTDGVTATALLVDTFSALGADVRGYIPNRFEDGYGLNTEALDEIKADGAHVVVTVDCGIRALEEIAYARSLGLDMIVTDHHTTSDELPSAVAIINAKRPDDPYPDKNLAGVGTAYKLASALLGRFKPNTISEMQLLDLVAVGTVADLVPLVGENRRLVKQGLETLRTPHRQGLYALMQMVDLDPRSITASDIGFMLGPRLNAAGRLASALEAYKLLVTKDVQEAGQLAQELDNLNRERQQITRDMLTRSEEMAVDGGTVKPLLFAADPEFNPGVVGLAASRLVDQYYRPAVVAYQGEEFTRASCRSIPEFHITDALDKCADILVRHGGHAAAAGFTVKNENLEALIERLEADAKEQLHDLDLRPVLHADVEVQLVDLRQQLLDFLAQLEPTGYGNPEPLFITRNLRVKRSRAVGRDGAHLKLSVTDGWETMDAIAFRQGHWQANMPAEIDLLYAFELNEFQGRTNLQLNVRDIKPSNATE